MGTKYEEFNLYWVTNQYSLSIYVIFSHYTSLKIYILEDLKPHLCEVLDFKSLLVSYLKNESAMRI